jgi:hypothetical protein
MKSISAIWLASSPSLSRKDGNAPPKPPSNIPLTTNIKVTAPAARRLPREEGFGASAVAG